MPVDLNVNELPPRAFMRLPLVGNLDDLAEFRRRIFQIGRIAAVLEQLWNDQEHWNRLHPEEPPIRVVTADEIEWAREFRDWERSQP